MQCHGLAIIVVTLVAGGCAAEGAAERVERGRELLEFGQVDAALLQFAAARRVEPELLAAQVGYQDCKLARGRGPDLVRMYDDWLAEAPADRDRLYLAARVRERVEDRVRDLGQVVARFPNFYDAVLELARAQVRAQQFGEALSSFAAASRLRSGDPSPVLGLGIAHRLRGDFVAAEREFKRAIALDPNSALGYHHLALLYLDNRAARLVNRDTVDVSNQKLAERLLLKAIEVDPDDFDARSDLAGYYYESRRSREARRLYLDHMAAHPLDPRPYVSIAEYNVAEGQAEMAEKHLLRFLNKAPEDPQVLVNLAVICSNDSRIVAAEEHLRRAIELHPRLGTAWLDLGHVLQGAGSFQEASAAFTMARSCDETLAPEATLNQARSEAALGRRLRDDATALESAGGAQVQVDAIGERATKALVAARGHYIDALELQPGHGTLRTEFAKVCLNLRDGGEAIRQLQLAREAPAERPGDLELDYLLACGQLMTQQLDDAAASVDRILLVEPRHPGAIDLRREIQRARRSLGQGR